MTRLPKTVEVPVCVCVCVYVCNTCMFIVTMYAKCQYSFPVCLTVRPGCPGSNCRSIPRAWVCTRPHVCTAGTGRGCLRASSVGRGGSRDNGTAALEERSNTNPNVLESASPGTPQAEPVFRVRGWFIIRLDTQTKSLWVLCGWRRFI